MHDHSGEERCDQEQADIQHDPGLVDIDLTGHLHRHQRGQHDRCGEEACECRDGRQRDGQGDVPIAEKRQKVRSRAAGHGGDQGEPRGDANRAGHGQATEALRKQAEHKHDEPRPGRNHE